MWSLDNEKALEVRALHIELERHSARIKGLISQCYYREGWSDLSDDYERQAKAHTKAAIRLEERGT